MSAEHAHLAWRYGYSRYLKMALHATRRTRGAKCQTDLHPFGRGRSLGRGFHDEIGTVTIILVPRPAAVWISSFAPICAALSRILPSPTPSLFSRRSLEIPDPLSVTCKMRLGGSQRRVTVTTVGLA